MNLYTSFLPTAIVLGSVGPVKPASSKEHCVGPLCDDNKLCIHLIVVTTYTYNATFLPSPSVMSSVTCTLETSKAPFFSASSASHLSNLAHATQHRSSSFLSHLGNYIRWSSSHCQLRWKCVPSSPFYSRGARFLKIRHQFF